MKYPDVCEWTRLYDLIENRVSVINQMLGARYDRCLENPCLVKYRRGEYSCLICGIEFCAWRIYDLDTTRRAMDRLEALNDGIWYLVRSGGLTFTIPQPTLNVN